MTIAHAEPSEVRRRQAELAERLARQEAIAEGGSSSEARRTAAEAAEKERRARELLAVDERAGRLGLREARAARRAGGQAHRSARSALARHAQALFREREPDRRAIAAVLDRVGDLDALAAHAGAAWGAEIAAMEAARRRRELVPAVQAGKKNLERVRAAARRLRRGTMAEIGRLAAVPTGSLTWAIRALEDEGSVRATGRVRRGDGNRPSKEYEWIGDGAGPADA